MRLCVWLSGWALITPAFAQEAAEPKLPTGPAPAVARARFADSELVVTEASTTKVTEKYTVQVPVQRVVNGQVIADVVTEVRTRTREIPVFVPLRFTLKEAEVYNLNGEKISKEKLTLRLKKERLVLVSKNGKPLSKAYRAIYRDDVLVVVPKKAVPARKPPVRRPAPNLPDPMRG